MTTVFPDDEPDPEFRIVGDAWRNMAGSNIRGRRFSQCTPRLYASQYRMHFRAIRDTGRVGWAYGRPTIAGREHVRSEEHTSELQSLMRISYAVFCLKKKKKQTKNEY